MKNKNNKPVLFTCIFLLFTKLDASQLLDITCDIFTTRNKLENFSLEWTEQMEFLFYFFTNHEFVSHQFFRSPVLSREHPYECLQFIFSCKKRLPINLANTIEACPGNQKLEIIFKALKTEWHYKALKRKDTKLGAKTKPPEEEILNGYKGRHLNTIDSGWSWPLSTLNAHTKQVVGSLWFEWTTQNEKPYSHWIHKQGSGSPTELQRRTQSTARSCPSWTSRTPASWGDTANRAQGKQQQHSGWYKRVSFMTIFFSFFFKSWKGLELCS